MSDESPDRPREPSESQIVRRYLDDRAPEDMSRRTKLIRDALRDDRRRRTTRYRRVLGVVAIVAVLAGAYGYVQHRRVQAARAAAAEIFYDMKALELEVAQLRLTTEERASYRARQENMARRYRDYLEQLGIYSERTPEDERLIYQVVHRFGESEINVPQDFVREVRRFIQRWQRTPRLRDAMERASAHDYATRISTIMLENDLPPEFFYLALQESSLKTEAVGPRTRFGIAKGMWQIMPGTAKEYGLLTGPLVGQPLADPKDQRHDFEKSTEAAAQYLRDIYSTDAQASGLLVIAAYNWGQGNVLRLIRSLPQNPRDRNYWQLLAHYRDRVPQETYDYVLAVVSAAVIGEKPELFGFAFSTPLEKPPEAAAEPVAGP